MGSPSVEVQAVSRRFGRVWAVRRVSLEVTSGEVVALQGHNGSGKSTLLRVMAGVLTPTEGSVSVEGLDVIEQRREVGHRIGWLDHQPALYPELTGRENLEFWRRLAGSPRSEEQLSDVLKRVDLSAVAHRPVRGWSRGMMQRLGLAGLLLKDAPVWLLDEPITGLDAAGRETLRGILQQGRDEGRAIVVVTHDPQSLGDAVGRTVRMDRGRLLDPEEAS